MDLIYDQLMEDYGAVNFEAFINLLVCSALVSSLDKTDLGLSYR